MTTWDNYLAEEEKANKAKMAIDGSNLILFFKKNGTLYGAPEESRLTFAKLKNPSKDDEDMLDDANFLAINLLDALDGQTTQHLFGLKDLSDIKVIDRDKCEKLLLKHQSAADPAMMRKKQGDDNGLIKIDGDT